MSAAPTEIAVHRHEPRGRMGFFTDTTVCIGCKACEVACKQWNDLPADGYDFGKGRSLDHTGSLSASTWRHVHFVEIAPPREQEREAARAALGAGAGGRLPNIPATGTGTARCRSRARTSTSSRSPTAARCPRRAWTAGCSPPTSASTARTPAAWTPARPARSIRTEFETVIVQPDVCNGCGYCVTACPFGVIDRDPYDGRAAKCTLCYDRLQDGMEPACAKACPTDSIQFGPYDELVERAKGRVLELHERGLDTAYLYGAADEGADQLAGGLGAFFLLTEPPERFGLPAHGRLADPGQHARRHRRGPGRGRHGGGDGRRLAADRPPQEAAMSHGHGPPPEQRILERGQRRVDGRDMTPAVGRRGEPGGWRRAVEGSAVRGFKPRFADGRWSFLYRDTRYAAGRRRERRRGGEPPAAMRGGPDVPVEVKGPVIRPNVWTWEVPVYFWFGGMATGASFTALACEIARRRALRPGARGSWRSARPDAAARCSILDLGRPERFLHMFRIFKTALADVDGRLVPDRVLELRRRRRASPTCSGGAARRAP